LQGLRAGLCGLDALAAEANRGVEEAEKALLMKQAAETPHRSKGSRSLVSSGRAITSDEVRSILSGLYPNLLDSSVRVFKDMRRHCRVWTRGL